MEYDSPLNPQGLFNSNDAGHPEQLYHTLQSWFKPYDKVVVALSGGVDSALVLRAAVDGVKKENVAAYTGDSPSLARSELRAAVSYAASLQVEHLVIKTDEMSNDDYLLNQGNRCYFCKKTLYQTLIGHLHNTGFDTSNFVIVDGTHLEDLADTRPGLQAAKESGVRHPLQESNLGKGAVRAISNFLNINVAEKPESACLSSRITIGNRVSLEKLIAIEYAEEKLRELGFSTLRVRCHELPVAQKSNSKPSLLARIEVLPQDILAVAKQFELVSASIKEAGFVHVTLDLEGYKKGGRATK